MIRKASAKSMESREENIYEWDVVEIGAESPPYVYEVTADKIADYCRAVRYENPVYVNDLTAIHMGFPGIFAPPTMLYVYAPLRLDDIVSATGYKVPEQPRYNPRSTRLFSTDICFQGMLVRPCDVITSTTRVVSKFRRRANKFIKFRVTAHNHRNENVAEYDYVCLWETQALEQADQRPAPGSANQPRP